MSQHLKILEPPTSRLLGVFGLPNPNAHVVDPNEGGALNIQIMNHGMHGLQKIGVEMSKSLQDANSMKSLGAGSTLEEPQAKCVLNE